MDVIGGGENTAVISAVIVAVPTVLVSAVVPVIMAILSARDARQSRRDAYAREDAIADRAARAAELLAKNTALAAEKQQRANEALARVQRINGDKIDVIHNLVNSAMTTALQAEYDAIDREIALLTEVMKLRGTEHAPDMIDKVRAAAQKLAALRIVLDDRAVQQNKVEHQQDTQRLAMAAIEAANEKAAAAAAAGTTPEGLPIVKAPVIVVPAAP